MNYWYMLGVLLAEMVQASAAWDRTGTEPRHYTDAIERYVAWCGGESLWQY